MLECVAKEGNRAVEHQSYEERLWELEFFSLKKTQLKDDHCVWCGCLVGMVTTCRVARLWTVDKIVY